MKCRKKIIIIAGPNGAGKTTFATEYLPNEGACIAFVNADLIAAGLAPFAPQAAALRAGRLMLEQIACYAQQGRDFAFETTLSGLTYLRLIRGWQKQGYRVKLIYLSLETADLAVARVAARTSQGGHDIPEEVVRRRFKSSWQNFNQRYKLLADAWIHYDNSGQIPVFKAESVNS